jgi:hypothetical protein
VDPDDRDRIADVEVVTPDDVDRPDGPLFGHGEIADAVFGDQV